MLTRLKTGHLKPKPIFDLQHTVLPEPDPTCYTAASKSPHWRQAMSEEFLALQKQATWTLVPAPPNKTIIGSRWTFRTKRSSDGSIIRHKARLVAQGFKQVPGIDYFDTFSPVAKLPTIRILLLTALQRKWPIRQLDVANAFLHGLLEEHIYMEQPQGFVDVQHPTYVCHLNKALYGLKQAPRQWHTTLSQFLLSKGFHISIADPSLYTYKHQGTQLYFLIYVDDILLTGNCNDAIDVLILELHSSFTIKDLGSPTTFLGIQISTSPNQYFLHQTSYLHTILTNASMQNCKPVLTPTPSKLNFSSLSQDPLPDPTPYRQLAGALQYLTITRPDIAFAVNMVCQFMHSPLQCHLQLLKRILRYLKGTPSHGIPITPGDMQLRSYSDSDWAGDSSTRRSTTGYCTFLGSTLVSWCVQK